jgi:N-acetylmuramoyl-L-alanine amidase
MGRLIPHRDHTNLFSTASHLRPLLRRCAIVFIMVTGPLLTLAGCDSSQRHTTLGRPLAPITMTREPSRLPTPPRNPLYDPPPRVTSAPKPTPQRWQPRPRPRPTRMIGPKRIVIDAGHGGKDSGAVGRGPMVEKEVNLRVAKILVDELEARGAEVIESRPNDRFISLNGRASTAERTRCDLFVSIHADAAQREAASGTTVYIARNASRESQRAGQAIEEAFVRNGFESRGVRKAGFRVLVGHSRPAVLVECGFLSNREEARMLAQSAYQQRVALSIAEGITDHFTR